MPRGNCPVGKNADPESRRERARNAALARNSVEAAISRIVDRAPDLTHEQLAKLRTILAPAGR